jgi:glycerophosphoryl diester phosphodiesterase
MLIIGHRGAADLAPENTLKSVQAAMDSGVDMIEVDISLCRTGEAVLMHDAKVDAQTDGNGYICDFSLTELKKLDAGDGEQIPTLQEVIDLIDSRCPLNIEIKGRDSSKEVDRILHEEISRKGRNHEDFLVSSFDHMELQSFGSLCPEIRISPIISCYPISLASLAEDMGAWSLNMSLDSINSKIVEDAHNRGIKILVYTVNFPEELEKMKKMNIDGVYTNNRYRLIGKN